MAMRAPSSRRWGLLCLALVLAAVAAPSFVLGTSSAPVPERTTHIGAAAFKGESEPQFHEQKPTGAGAVASFASAFLALVLFGSAAQAWTHTGIADWPAEFPMCSEKSQSPIDLSSSVSGKGDTLAAHVKYEPMSERSIKHNGHVMQVDGGFGTFKLPDGDYQVKQFHFHFPAEHSVDGKLSAGEMHIVHQKVGSSGTNDLAVIGIMLEESKSSAPESKFLQTLFKNAPAEGTASEVGNVDLNVFNNEFKDFYHYKGSLTTPPCAEGVHWYVAKKTAPVSSETVQAFKAKFKEDDNRPVQPLNGRELVLDKLALDKEFA